MTRPTLDEWSALVREAAPGLSGNAAREWMQRLQAARPPPGDALRMLIADGRCDEALELVPTLATFYQQGGHTREGYDTLLPIVDAFVDASDLRRAQATTSVSILAFRSGMSAEARRTAETALQLARRTDDVPTLIRSLSQMARVGLRENDLAMVRNVCAEALYVADWTGDEADRRLPLHCLAEGTRLGGDLDAARPLYLESIALNERLGNADMVAMEQGNLAALETAAGRHGEAARLLILALHQLETTRDMYLLPYAILNAGGLLEVCGETRVGATLLGTAEGIFENTGMAIDPADRPVFDRHVSRARDELGETIFAASFEAGRRSDVGDAIIKALAALGAVAQSAGGSLPS